MKSFLIVAVVLILAGTGYYYFRDQHTTLIIPTVMQPPPPENSGVNSSQGREIGGLLNYQKDLYESAISSDKLVVLYFYANWCPICRAEYPKMQEAFNELSGERVIGFRVNYNDNETDSDETALARQFGVAYQHTKVFLKDGKQVLKAPDSWEKDRYLSEIRNHIAHD